uniref:Uncharacterized protein n=1 Tax=Molossus molossus TaxID=27622 RepID=A0A7J8DTG8_MOLMO|nr:hypothetical protein HJG59_009203 [Molossus molossus]
MVGVHPAACPTEITSGKAVLTSRSGHPIVTSAACLGNELNRVCRIDLERSIQGGNRERALMKNHNEHHSELNPCGLLRFQGVRHRFGQTQCDLCFDRTPNLSSRKRMFKLNPQSLAGESPQDKGHGGCGRRGDQQAGGVEGVWSPGRA